MSTEPKDLTDWKQKYEDLLKSYLIFVENYDNLGFQMQVVGKNKKAELTGAPPPQTPPPPNRAARRRAEKEIKK